MDTQSLLIIISAVTTATVAIIGAIFAGWSNLNQKHLDNASKIDDLAGK